MRVEKACGVIGRKTIEIKDVELELFGGNLRIDRNDWRTVPGNFLARCRRQLLAPFGALDPAIFDKAGKTDNQQRRERGANSKRIDANHGSYPSKNSAPNR